MAQAPTKLFTEVDEGIAFMSGRDIGEVTPKKRLVSQLGLTKYQLKALASGFQAIARRHVASSNEAKKIKRNDCLKLTTVHAARKLVAESAHYDAPPAP